MHAYVYFNEHNVYEQYVSMYTVYMCKHTYILYMAGKPHTALHPSSVCLSSPSPSSPNLPLHLLSLSTSPLLLKCSFYLWRMAAPSLPLCSPCFSFHTLPPSPSCPALPLPPLSAFSQAAKCIVPS